jgi:hypothetical protein
MELSADARETEALLPKTSGKEAVGPLKMDALSEGDKDFDKKGFESESTFHRAQSKLGSMMAMVKPSMPEVDVTAYQPSTLTNFATLFLAHHTIWTSPSVWKMMGKLCMISVTVGIIVFFSVADPAQIEASKFQQIGLFLRVFVGLLLGFFFDLLCPALVQLRPRLHGAGRLRANLADAALGAGRRQGNDPDVSSLWCAFRRAAQGRVAG